jgi:hypothetical protein
VLFVVFVLVCAGVFLYPRVLPALLGRSSEDIRTVVRELAAKREYAGKIHVSGSGILAVGIGRIEPDTAQGRLLARRAALADARRNLLALREDFNGRSASSRSRSISGSIGRHGISSEGVDGNLYKLELEMSFEEWLTPDS